jgi:hypothetical protein
MRAVLRDGIDWAGLAVGPAAWAISTQGNYSLASLVCGRSLSPVPPVALILLVLALAGAMLSWRAFHVSGAGRGLLFEESGQPHAFRALLSALIAVLFAAVILMQGVAGLILTGCER